MSYKIVIPARLESTRLKRKLLRTVRGKSIIQYVYEQCLKTSAQEVVIAVDHQDLADAITEFGGTCIRTSPSLSSGTERVAQAANLLRWPAETIVVNVQGDEPSISPELIDAVASCHIDNHGQYQISTAAVEAHCDKEYKNPHAVKVVVDDSNSALYFSRSPIPYYNSSKDEHPFFLHHIGIYAYQVNYLQIFSSYSTSPLSECEKLEQLKALENGDRIKVIRYNRSLDGGIDTEEDLKRFAKSIKGD